MANAMQLEPQQNRMRRLTRCADFATYSYRSNDAQNALLGGTLDGQETVPQSFIFKRIGPSTTAEARAPIRIAVC